MRHAVFGEITYDEHERAWLGSCRLREFAEVGKVTDESCVMDDPDPQFLDGRFALE